jgi:hypothetical protein
MTRPGPQPVAGPAVERYLAEVSAGLPGPARAQAGVLAELRSGLLDAADAHRSAGVPSAQAAEAAIAEFGDPGEIAGGFRAEIAAGQARRVAVMVLVTGPLVGLVWLAEAAAGHPGAHLGLPWQWAGLFPPPGLLLVAIAVAVAVTAWGALGGIASTGRLTRWLPDRPRRAPMAAAVAGLGAVGADALGLTLLAAQLATVPGKLSPVLAAAAAAASLARLMFAGRAARRCLVLRASVSRTGRSLTIPSLMNRR